ncbi:MAG: hypothetical protein KDA60_02525 [Planctomycetales bacterium]|nr:hypothetical protein [Planctomycetales bacterium]
MTALLVSLSIAAQTLALDAEKATPGYRPDTAEADQFVRSAKSATIAVYPVVIREKVAGTSYNTESQKAAILKLHDAGIRQTIAVATQLDTKELQGDTQWKLFQAGLASFGKQIDEAKLAADYAIIVELLMDPRPVDAWTLFGVHCYVLDASGKNAFSFLLNSHHQLFVNSDLTTRDLSEAGRQALTTKTVHVAIDALNQQMERARAETK